MIRVLQCGMTPNIGGIEAFIMNVYRNIDREKVQFDFLTTYDNIAFEDEIKKMGGKIYRITSRKENLLKNYFELKNFLKTHKEYSTIHVHMITCSYITPLKIASKCNKHKIISHSHSEWKGTNFITKTLHKINHKKVSDISTHRFACSDVAAKYMFEDNPATIIPNAIDTKKYIYNSDLRNEKRKELNLENKFVIGNVGRLSYPKNHDFMIDVFAEVYKKNKDARLVLVGGGELESDIIDKVNKLNLSDVVHILGARQDVNELLNMFDVFLMPSHFEGLPIAMIECQANGLKVFASDVITKEVKLTDLVEYISLDESAEFWASKILNVEDSYERKNMFDIICEANYDISNNANWIEEFYINE